MDDESSAVIEAILREEEQSSKISYDAVNDDHGWQTVSYQRRRGKHSAKPSEIISDFQKFGSGDVFQSIERQSVERRRRMEAQMAAIDADRENYAVKLDDGEAGSGSESGAGAFNGGAEEKKAKPKKLKKPKVTVADAAAKIDDCDLAAFLADITSSYESQENILLMRFADYFGRAFASVTASQFPWMKTFKESSVAKMVDIPLSHISKDVYKTSSEWLNQRSFEALGSFVLWLWDSILADLDIHQGSAKGSKKLVQQAPSKSQRPCFGQRTSALTSLPYNPSKDLNEEFTEQKIDNLIMVAIFVVLAMTLRRKPEVLPSLVPILRDTSKYQDQDKLPVTVWVIAQACEGDLAAGLFVWVHLLLPILSNKSSCNPQSRDLILQLLERILASPKARPILLNGAVRKGERLVPPAALELLMRATFPASSARVKATERFEAVYPTLKEIALCGSPGSKSLKQITQIILQFAVKAAGEGIPDLSREASDIVIWCLTQNADCYKQWENLYLDNLEASVLVLRKLANEWKDYSVRLPTCEPLKATLTSFRQKNEEEMATEENAPRLALFKDAEKHCKLLTGRLSRGHVCLKSMVVLSVALAVGAAAVISQNMTSEDMKKFLVDFI